MNCKTKSFMTKKKAFTLIELLIVIAIIGILFIVLVSKVDFATDKAKATGVQTDFRIFQMAFDTVAKENAGFNTFGWDTGDLNQDGIRNSYDEGDNGAGGGIAKNGIQDGTEVFTGHKAYDETFTKVFSLKKAKADGTLETNYDRDALNRLETAINANLDPKLHITIKDDGEIVMANGAKDPWNKEYHGWYISNAEVDKKDRGAIVMYSDGANNEFGSEHTIANGVVSVSIPGNNKWGKDDYSLVSLYTYINGYGEVKNITTGFSNNQNANIGSNDVIVNNTPESPNVPDLPDEPNTPDEPIIPDTPTNEEYQVLSGGLYKTGTNEMMLSWQELHDQGIINTRTTWFTITLPERLEGDLHINENITSLGGSNFFSDCDKLTGIFIPKSVTSMSTFLFSGCENLTTVVFDINSSVSIPAAAFENCAALKTVILSNKITSIENGAFENCIALESIDLPSSIKTLGNSVFLGCSSLIEVNIPEQVTNLGNSVFGKCVKLKHVNIHDNIQSFGEYIFDGCTSLESIYIPEGVTKLPRSFVRNCTSLTEITLPASLVELGHSALKNCNISTIVLPDNLQKIDSYAISEHVKTLYLPSSVTEIGARPFGYPKIENLYFNGDVSQWLQFMSLQNITIFQAGSTNLKTGTNLYFSDGNKNYILIEDLVIDNITSIPNEAFYGIGSLKSVHLSDTVTSIGYSSFAYCYQLTSARLPNNADYGSGYIFNNSNAMSIIDIGSGPIQLNKLYLSGNNNVTIYYRGNMTDYLTNIDFGDRVYLKDIYMYNESNEFELITDVVIPDSISVIPSRAFISCESITRVVLHENVTQIGRDAFENLPRGQLICYALIPPTFDYIKYPLRSTIYVPEASVEMYKSADGWSLMASNIQGI